MKSLLIAISVLALTSGAAFAQGAQSPAPSSAMPAAPPSAGSSAQPYGTGGAGTMHHATARHVSSARVKLAQQALKEEGLYKGKIDGQFGPKTRSAVAQFQKQNGLKQTAQLDRRTMMKLKEGGASGGGTSGGSMPSGGSQ
jgi:hypothetical protein